MLRFVERLFQHDRFPIPIKTAIAAKCARATMPSPGAQHRLQRDANFIAGVVAAAQALIAQLTEVYEGQALLQAIESGDEEALGQFLSLLQGLEGNS